MLKDKAYAIAHFCIINKNTMCLSIFFLLLFIFFSFFIEFSKNMKLRHESVYKK